jgi:hypothetical protein
MSISRRVKVDWLVIWQTPVELAATDDTPDQRVHWPRGVKINGHSFFRVSNRSASGQGCFLVSFRPLDDSPCSS